VLAAAAKASMPFVDTAAWLFRGGSNPVGGRLDAFVAEVDLSLAAVMRDVQVEGEQDLASGKAAVGRVVNLAELPVGQVGDDWGAIFERVVQELDDGVFVLVAGGGCVGCIGVLESGAEGKVGEGDVRHQFAKGHGAAVGTESILLRWHSLGDGDGRLAERAEVQGIFGGSGMRVDGAEGRGMRPFVSGSPSPR
jgi:hypothetical protein